MRFKDTEDGEAAPARQEKSSGVAARRSFLRTAAGLAVGGGALAACGPGQSDKAAGSGSASPSGSAATSGVKSQVQAGPQQPPTGLDVKKIGDLTGPGITTDFQMEATDLGVPATTPDGRTLYIFGDSYKEPRVDDKNDWRSPTGLYSETKDLNGGVKWSGAVGGKRAEQLLPYPHNNPEFSTVLPSDVITIGKTMYLHVMVNKGLMNVIRTEIWKSEDSGESWQNTGVKFKGDEQNGLFQLLTWGLGDNGWVYIYSTKFDRKNSIILSRVHKDKILDPVAYEAWGWHDGGWKWGKHEASPILEGKFGELCLRPIDGKWLLTCFNAGTGTIEGRVVDTPDANLKDAPAKTLIYGGKWGEEDDAHVAMLYGGYVIPGSTLKELHLSVSQWKNLPDNPGGWPYHVMQHRVRGAF